MSQFYFGFDPGGESGVAIARVEADAVHFKSAKVTCVDEATAWFRETAREGSPAGIGIDALLTWSTGGGGWRQSDRDLRKAYPAKAGSVICSNSAYGAMAVQGMAFAFRARVEWPNAMLNEVHPKVLFHAVAPDLDYPRKSPSPASEEACMWFERLGCRFDGYPMSEHAFDAVLGAWATFIGGEWPEDFSKRDRPAAILPVGDVRYFGRKGSIRTEARIVCRDRGLSGHPRR